MNVLIPLIKFNNIRNIVELGCGDFWIMRHVLGNFLKEGYKYFYTGLDVVEDLIKYNVEHFNHPTLRFICRDVTEENENFPDGDILIIRQVLQHLNNADIKKILDKAKKFKFLFITEHICDSFDAVYNVDKQTDGSIRLFVNSGVYLEHAPYNFKNIIHLLKVEEYGGIIRSSLIINE